MLAEDGNSVTATPSRRAGSRTPTVQAWCSSSTSTPATGFLAVGDDAQVKRTRPRSAPRHHRSVDGDVSHMKLRLDHRLIVSSRDRPIWPVTASVVATRSAARFPGRARVAPRRRRLSRTRRFVQDRAVRFVRAERCRPRCTGRAFGVSHVGSTALLPPSVRALRSSCPETGRCPRRERRRGSPSTFWNTRAGRGRAPGLRGVRRGVGRGCRVQVKSTLGAGQRPWRGATCRFWSHYQFGDQRVRATRWPGARGSRSSPSASARSNSDQPAVARWGQFVSSNSRRSGRQGRYAASTQDEETRDPAVAVW